MEKTGGKTLLKIYRKLYKSFGPQHWWPGDGPFEVMVGAILTQNTNWQNVERAINNLKKSRCLSAKALKNISEEKLAQLIRPAGYFNIKSRRLKNFINFLFEKYNGSLKKMDAVDTHTLRKDLLLVNGVGPETADSILLYALDRTVFVVDAYTKRIFMRHNIINSDATYDNIQSYFMGNLKKDVRLFNEYHALIVRLGKEICKTKPDCLRCPLKNIIDFCITKMI